jgi:GDPmannose 4,6-dehydratase
MKKVIITGILGQDGANMAEYLLSLYDEFGVEEYDYEIYGMMRRSANPNLKNIEKIKNHPRFNLQFLDLGDSASIDTAVKEIEPDYFINFAANSFVGISWKMPEQVMNVNALGVLRCLEAIRKFKPDCRFYSAGSSEEWGNVDYSPQDINHPIKPRSPYGASKAAARHLVKVYRESYNMYAVHGILFNHEGTKRGEEFVTRKISKGVARIKDALDSMLFEEEVPEPIELGNLDAKRDWSDSRDFVEGVWLMLNQDSPKDYILSSGEAHSIRDFIEKAFAVAGIKGSWHGEGLEEVFVDGDQVLVKINPEFYRPAEVDLLLGDSTPIRKELGWEPKISFDKLVESMVQYDLDETRRN